jgi:hypothetical protein
MTKRGKTKLTPTGSPTPCTVEIMTSDKSTISVVENSAAPMAIVPKTIPGADVMVIASEARQQSDIAVAPGPKPVQRRRPYARVGLRRVNADHAKPYPPDGDGKAWWSRLKAALGTGSSDFVTASLIQLQAAARLPGSGISEIAVNAALALVEAARPKDEVEGALAVQMACTHVAAMAVLARLGGGNCTERRVAALGSAAGRLLRAYAMQVEALRRLRRGSNQFIRVEHVHVHAGAQAIVGAVNPTAAEASPFTVSSSQGG